MDKDDFTITKMLIRYANTTSQNANADANVCLVESIVAKGEKH